MKKTIFIITILLIMTSGLVFSACSSNQEDHGKNAQNAQGDQNKETTLEYPEKEIKMVVPYSAGGGTDTVARAIAEFVDLEKPMVITNLEGGSSKIGTLEVVGSEADGYTLLAHSVTAVVSGYHSGLYDEKIWKEMEPVAAMVSQSGGIVVRADSDWNTIEDLVKYAKENPGELSIGIPGIGGGGHVLSAIFANATGIEVNYVPFEGSADARAALAGGHVDIMGGFVSEFYDFIQEGEFKMLASTGTERSSKLPDVPTFIESGIDFVLNHRNGIFAPKGTPKEIIDKLNAELKEVAENEEFKKLMDSMVIESAYLSADDFSKELQDLDSAIEPVSDLIRGDS